MNPTSSEQSANKAGSFQVIKLGTLLLLGVEPGDAAARCEAGM
jgi:hypothetical protein